MAYIYCNIAAHRLGNALFMAASIIGIAHANNMQPLFPANWKHRKDFNIPDEYFGDCHCEQTYTESTFHFTEPYFNPDKNCELRGYFQSERYWRHISEQIKEMLMPKGAMPSAYNTIIALINGCL